MRLQSPFFSNVCLRFSFLLLLVGKAAGSFAFLDNLETFTAESGRLPPPFMAYMVLDVGDRLVLWVCVAASCLLLVDCFCAAAVSGGGREEWKTGKSIKMQRTRKPYVGRTWHESARVLHTKYHATHDTLAERKFHREDFFDYEVQRCVPRSVRRGDCFAAVGPRVHSSTDRYRGEADGCVEPWNFEGPRATPTSITICAYPGDCRGSYVSWVAHTSKAVGETHMSLRVPLRNSG